MVWVKNKQNYFPVVKIRIVINSLIGDATEDIEWIGMCTQTH